MTPLLIEIEPFDLKTSARRLIRIADGLETDVFGLGELVWKPCLATRPSLTQELMSLDLGGRVQAGKARFEIHTALLDQSYLHNLKWTGAPVRIYRADNLAWPTPIEFEGTVSSRTIDLPNNIVGIEAEVATTFIEKPLLTLEFDGGGGINGEAETRGVLRPAGFGSCENIEPVWFDTVRWIGQIDGYGNTTGITKLMEGLNDFGPSVADYATYTALANAIDADAVLPGRWATCIAAGIVGLGAPPEGVIGVNATFGSNRIGAMIQRILTTHGSLAAGSIDSAAFNALDAAVAYNVHYWTKDQREIKDLIEALAASAIATPIVTFNKTISITRAVTSAAVATLDRSGSITPRVVDWKVGSAVSPVWSMKARAAMPANVLSHDQVNYADTLIDRGLFSMATVYRQGNVVWDATKASWVYTGAVASAGGALPVWPATSNANWENLTPPIDLEAIGAATAEQIAEISSDSILSPVEKPAVLIDVDTILNERAGIEALATSYGLTAEKNIYTEAVDDLNDYLATLTLPVAWNNNSGNTAIVAAEFRSAFTGVYDARQDLFNAIPAASQQRLEPPTHAQTVPADYLGVVATSLFPITIRVKRYQSGNDISLSSAWEIVDMVPAAAATVAVTGGLASITALSANCTFKIRSTFAALPLDCLVLVNRQNADQPTSAAGASTGGTEKLDTSFATIGTSTAFSAISDLMTVKTGTAGTIDFFETLEIYPAGADPVGATSCEFIWRWRAVGGSFADMTAKVNDSSAGVFQDGEDFYESYSGSVSFIEQKTGLSANTDYEVQLFGRRNSGVSRTLTLAGQAKATGG